jgi:hypothetical protein
MKLGAAHRLQLRLAVCISAIFDHMLKQSERMFYSRANSRARATRHTSIMKTLPFDSRIAFSKFCLSIASYFLAFIGSRFAADKKSKIPAHPSLSGHPAWEAGNEVIGAPRLGHPARGGTPRLGGG